MVYLGYGLLKLPVNILVFKWICIKMKLFCAAEGCNLFSDKSKTLHKYTWMKYVTFHNFFKEHKRKRNWGNYHTIPGYGEEEIFWLAVMQGCVLCILSDWKVTLWQTQCQRSSSTIIMVVYLKVGKRRHLYRYLLYPRLVSGWFDDSLSRSVFHSWIPGKYQPFSPREYANCQAVHT